MKINVKNVALLLVVIGGGVGASVVALSRASNRRSSSIVNMTDTSMVSMQAENDSCEMCPSGNCPDGKCPQSESMMNVTMDKTMSMGGTMSVGASKESMGGEMVPEVSMANAVSQPMGGKSMAPKMGSAKMTETVEQSSVTTPKM